MTSVERLRGATARAAEGDASEATLGEYGVLVDGQSLKTGDAIEVRSPYNDELVAVVHRAGPAELETEDESADTIASEVINPFCVIELGGFDGA